jgi:hypothetical protein
MAMTRSEPPMPYLRKYRKRKEAKIIKRERNK